MHYQLQALLFMLVIAHYRAPAFIDHICLLLTTGKYLIRLFRSLGFGSENASISAASLFAMLFLGELSKNDSFGDMRLFARGTVSNSWVYKWRRR